MLRSNNTPVTINEITDILNSGNEKNLHELFYNENKIDNNKEDKIVDYIKYRDTMMLANIINSSNGDEYYYELYLGKCFPITHTFIGSTLYCDVLYHVNHLNTYEPRSPEYVYASGTYMIIFPDTGVRICGPSDFIKNIPYFEQIMNGNWAEKSTQLPVLMTRNDNEKEEVYVKGPIVYVCHAPLEMILYDTGDHKDGNISVSLLRHIERALNY
tara:strand:+ start:1015 stop:1656 length:642 start_codon:yes stop_codon:yes gene_type:complete